MRFEFAVKVPNKSRKAWNNHKYVVLEDKIKYPG